jgi:hypothetical protein
MLKYIPAGPLPPHQDYAAGYYRPSRTNEFVAIVGGCPSWEIAHSEARRLNNEAKARQTAAFIEHSARGTARGWYSDDNP